MNLLEENIISIIYLITYKQNGLQVVIKYLNRGLEYKYFLPQ